MSHIPVLLQEVLQHLDLKPGAIVVDGTLGSAGHTLEILKRIGSEGRLVGLDQDPESIARCQELLKEYPQASCHNENFKNLDKILDFLNIRWVDAVILDVGLSSNQLEEAARGFSFDLSGPLDMRMNPESPVTAGALLNSLSENEIAKIFSDYGNERWADKFARAIVTQRDLRPLATTADLVRTIEKVLPRQFSYAKGNRPSWARRHPATRVFQALRIAVNDELGALERGLPGIWKRMKPGGRIAVITFHSLEDRIVKNVFRGWARNHEARLITKKPLVASREEQIRNPRARSAKLRVVEKMP